MLESIVPVLASESAARTSLWALFVQSFDVFTVLLLAGSLVGVAVIFICLKEVKEANIAPDALGGRLLDYARQGRVEDIKDAVGRDDSFLSRVLRAGLQLHTPAKADKVMMREAAELAASEESARWFRKIDLLNVIGNLGPLVGLAGTVWGMILAFTSLGDSGGNAGPAQLSLGISKALFHTLLGLCVAIPCLAAYGVYRGIVDRLCTRGIVMASDVLEAIGSASAKEAAKES
jgi:biopolymer transport protein ExbB